MAESSGERKQVAYEVVQPVGYAWDVASGTPTPFFEPPHQGGRRIYLVCYVDGSVSWELRAKNGTVLEPDLSGGSGVE